MNPIQESIVRTITISSAEQSQIDRVEFLRTTIVAAHYHPNHGVNFPNTGNTGIQHMRDNLNALPEDDRGHLVGPVFSGPATAYNMFPQHHSVNHDYKQIHIVNSWCDIERRMRSYQTNNQEYIR